ncbi:MAG: heme-copper oxidase subunit III [Acidobacteriota bacterium]
MRVGLAAIIMLFTAFTSAYVVRKGLSNDWRPLQMPRVVWPSTLILLASSLTLERARRAFHDLRRLRFWWATTALLGLLFLAGQVWGWRQLAERGVYVNTNPSSSFFYLLTATHGIHLLGGVTALLFLSRKLWKARLTRGAAGVMALYWHSMDALWVYLLLLLVVWR